MSIHARLKSDLESLLAQVENVFDSLIPDEKITADFVKIFPDFRKSMIELMSDIYVRSNPISPGNLTMTRLVSMLAGLADLPSLTTAGPVEFAAVRNSIKDLYSDMHNLNAAISASKDGGPVIDKEMMVLLLVGAVTRFMSTDKEMKDLKSKQYASAVAFLNRDVAIAGSLFNIDTEEEQRILSRITLASMSAAIGSPTRFFDALKAGADEEVTESMILNHTIARTALQVVSKADKVTPGLVPAGYRQGMEKIVG
jgi:hypothetical protein